MGDSIHILQKDKEIASLKAQLAEAQAKVEAAGSDDKKCADENVSLLAKMDQERARLANIRLSASWR